MCSRYIDGTPFILLLFIMGIFCFKIYSTLLIKRYVKKKQRALQIMIFLRVLHATSLTTFKDNTNGIFVQDNILGLHTCL